MVPILSGLRRLRDFVARLIPGLREVMLLDLPAPRLRAYARETVVAEKYQAMVALGQANSRMKDFYDDWGVLSKKYRFNNERLARAVAATFTRREASIPVILPDAFGGERIF